MITARSLVDIMEDFLKVKGASANVYSIRYMKKKLLEFYGSRITIAEVDGKPDVVTFTDAAASILHTFSLRQEVGEEERKREIILTAANLIKSDIKKLESKCDFYPTPEVTGPLNKNLNYLPGSLKYFLERILSKNCELKVASIGQALMQGARPRSLIAHLQIGVGVKLHHQFGVGILLKA